MLELLDAKRRRLPGARLRPAGHADRSTSSTRIERDGRVTTLPVILYSDQPPPDGDDAGSKSLAQSVAFRQVCSPERLLDQTAFFLHSPVDKLPEPKRRMLEQLYQTDQVLAGKKVLIVDDDIRNIFALTSILEWRNMVIVSAETGRDAIKHPPGRARHRHRADGHHDARDGRPRHDASHPQAAAVQDACRSSP